MSADDEGLRLLGRHVAELAHELRNALHAIVNLADTIEDSESEEEPGPVRRLRERARSCRAMLEDAIALGGSGGSEPRILTDPARLVEDLVASHPPGTDTIELRARIGTVPEVSVRAARIERALLNLVQNAERAMTAANGAGRITVAAEARAQGDRIRLIVEDDGPGVPVADRARIFEPFVSATHGGTGGLGLTLARRIAEEHGGTLELESPAAGGARFVMTLPVVVETTSSGEPAGPFRVLVVDDDETTVDAYRRILELDSHEVFAETTGVAGLARLSSEPFDLALVDVKLTDLSGPDLYRRLRDVSPEAARRVIFATGDLLNETTRAFLNSTGNPYLIKPFEIDELRAAISVVGARL